MMINRTLFMVMTIAGLICAPGFALAQSAPTAPPHLKTIGKPSTLMDSVQSMIVMNSRGATLKGDKLTLTGITGNSIVFADRPARLAGHEMTSQTIKEWDSGNTFGKDPPNATVSAFSNKDGGAIKDAVVVLKSPKLEGDKLTFTVQVLEGDLTGANGPASGGCPARC